MPIIDIRSIAKDRGFDSLHEVLVEVRKYAKIRNESFYDFVNNKMIRYPSSLIDALCKALDCEPGDFIKREKSD
jgi:DNA-binding Xre family transcriptional regulator